MGDMTEGGGASVPRDGVPGTKALAGVKRDESSRPGVGAARMRPVSTVSTDGVQIEMTYCGASPNERQRSRRPRSKGGRSSGPSSSAWDSDGRKGSGLRCTQSLFSGIVTSFALRALPFRPKSPASLPPPPAAEPAVPAFAAFPPDPAAGDNTPCVSGAEESDWAPLKSRTSAGPPIACETRFKSSSAESAGSPTTTSVSSLLRRKSHGWYSPPEVEFCRFIKRPGSPFPNVRGAPPARFETKLPLMPPIPSPSTMFRNGLTWVAALEASLPANKSGAVRRGVRPARSSGEGATHSSWSAPWCPRTGSRTPRSKSPCRSRPCGNRR